MDVVIADRLQFAFTIMFHYLFPILTMGLGLFIARELCQLNRAVLLYEPRNGGGSVFRVVFSDPQRWEA